MTFFYWYEQHHDCSKVRFWSWIQFISFFLFLSWNVEIEVGEQIILCEISTWPYYVERDWDTRDFYHNPTNYNRISPIYCRCLSYIYHPLMWESHTKKPLPTHTHTHTHTLSKKVGVSELHSNQILKVHQALFIDHQHTFCLPFQACQMLFDTW